MALVQYAARRRVLADELGIEPEPATKALYRQIREGTLVAPQRAPSVALQGALVRVPALEPTVPADPSLDRVDAGVLPMDLSLEGERRTVTVVRADVRGSKDLLARVGIEAWAEIVDRARRALAETATRLGGTVDQSGAEGLVACFGATVAHEDDPERAVLAALAMQSEWGTCRAELAQEHAYSGLADEMRLLVLVYTGQVVVTTIEEDGPGCTAIQEALAFAAQGQAVADPGPSLGPELEKVWVSEATRRLVEPLFEWAAEGGQRGLFPAMLESFAATWSRAVDRYMAARGGEATDPDRGSEWAARASTRRDR